MITKLFLILILGTFMYMGFNYFIYPYISNTTSSSGGHSYFIMLCGAYFIIEMINQGG